ncbi:MAG: transcription factor TFIIIC subunit tfc4 [Chaenotheca gracillima]|nr:MAG: transcription factor TFIIIC subunit tfc4 [Chaenotheca gracillima]
MTTPASDAAAVKAQAQDAESLISSAKTSKDALEKAIRATELYMNAVQLTDNAQEQRQLKEKSRLMLRNAERLKKTLKDSQSSPAPKPASTYKNSSSNDGKNYHGLISSRELPTREKIILWEGSKLNGFTFPPWDDAPSPDEFELAASEEKYIDAPELRLSEQQLALFNGWKRLDEMLYDQTLSSVNQKGRDTLVKPSRDVVDLVQDVTPDCSVVASLCAGTARGERGHTKILSSTIFPYDHENRKPGRSSNGKYIYRLNFNGCYRRVVIDDRLPSSSSERALHVVDRNNPKHLWPALLEKAYLKVRGGYDFPGSNSGTDIWVISGWIPEQIFLKSDDTSPSEVWRRVFRAFQDGDVLLTIGTGRLTRREQSGLGLAAEHDFAVLDLKEIGNRRLLLVKNPWSQGTIWKGKLPLSHDLDSGQESRTVEEIVPSAEQLTPGTFWIDLDNVMQSFESFYLNWNPALFKYREDIHFSWDLTSSSGPPGSFDRNPQFSLCSKSDGPVWVLLNRHFKTGEEEQTKQAPADPVTEGEGSTLGFLCLYIFDRGGQRVFLSDGALHRGNYVDSPQALIRLDCPANSTFTIVAAQQFLPQSLYSFTLSTFSLRPTVISVANNKYTHTISQQSSWTRATAGGNATSSEYPTNPQFSIHVPARTDLVLILETTNKNLSINVKLAWGGGKRMTKVSTRDIVGQSGEYRPGCALAEMRAVEAGAYTVICSTFEAGQLGAFSLRASSMVECQLRPIPSEEAGRLSRCLPPAIFSPGSNRVLAPVTCFQTTRMIAIARYPGPAERKKYEGGRGGSSSPPKSPLMLSLELGQGPTKQIITVSNEGEYSDAPMGVRTPDVDLLTDMRLRGGLWLVLERLGGGASAEGSERIDVEILSDARVDVEAWGVGEG